MKKHLFVAVTAFLFLSLGLFVACHEKPAVPERQGIERFVSTYHDAVYVGANEDFTVSFVTGEAEKLIVIDGKVGETAPFATLTVTPLSSGLFNNTYTYHLKGETGEKTGDLVKDVIGAAFSAEIDAPEQIGKILSVSIVAEGVLESDVPLANVVEKSLSWREILSLAEKALESEITAESDTGELPREIYVKLVGALADADAPYYYYVSFMKSPSDYWALLLDPASGEIISKKV